MYNIIGVWPRSKGEVEEDEEQILLRRSLSLHDGSIENSEWPQLRALLLANSAPMNGVVLLK